jgi:hypothetical protein
MSTKILCHCCGYRTLDAHGQDAICPVCFWQDDGQSDATANEVWGGPNGTLSLTAARENFRGIGASSQARLRHVRAPLPEELE